MNAQLHRCGMVGKYGYAYRSVCPSAHFLINRFHYSSVKILYCLQFQFQITVVSSLIACFHMQIHEVVLSQHVYRSLRLVLVISVGKPCHALHCHPVETCITSYTSYQVYRRDYVAFLYLRIHLLQCVHLGSVSAAPRPYAVGCVFLLCGTLLVERVLLQKLLRLQYKRVYYVGSLLRSHSVTVPAVFPSVLRS